MKAPTRSSVQDLIADWPDESRELAMQLIGKYGQPGEATPERLIWTGNHPWKHTTLFRQGTRHDFPSPHLDFLEQAIDYRVPVEMACDLARYDGSLTMRRTRGELSAFCNAEAVNFLSINLADEICTGRTDVAGARRQIAENVTRLSNGETPPLAQGFTFSVMRGGTADPDCCVL